MESSEQIVEAYGNWLKSWSASTQTYRGRTKAATVLLGHAGGVERLTAETIQSWLARPELVSGWTRATYHAHFTCFCKWLVATRRIASNPMEDVRKPKRPKSAPRPLSEVEVARVLAKAEGRVRDYILLALLAGLRAHEIAKLRGEDVTVDGIYVDGKGGVRATIPTHPDLWAMSQRYPSHGYWFPGASGGHILPDTVTYTVGRLFRSVGVSGSVHRCRHVYGTRLLRSGTHIRTVQQLMRHANLDTTAAYTAVNEDELRAAINLLSAS